MDLARYPREREILQLAQLQHAGTLHKIATMKPRRRNIPVIQEKTHEFGRLPRGVALKA